MQKNLVKHEPIYRKNFTTVTTVLINPIHEIEQVKRCIALLLNSPVAMIIKSTGHNTDKPS